MAVPYTFGSATSAIPLSQLDSNFATTITLGNTAIQLGNTVTTLNNMTLANVTVTTVSGASANAVVYTNSTGQVTANSSVIALDTSGNLGIGNTPSSKLDVSGVISLQGTTLPSAGTARIFSRTSDSSTYIQTATGGTFYLLDGSQNTMASFGSSTLTFSTGNTERARIDTSGYSKFSNNASYTNLSGTYHELNNSNANYVCVARNSSSNPSGIDSYFSAVAPNGTGNTFYYAEDSAAQRFAVRSNGGIANFSANNVNLSDRREKTNFAPAGDYLAKICAIPVQTFNYIDQNLEEDGGLTLGVVAQDVQAVAPELVMESNWAKSGEEPKMRLSIYQTDLQYALMKAIQELKAELDTAKAEIAALKGAK